MEALSLAALSTSLLSEYAKEAFSGQRTHVAKAEFDNSKEGKAARRVRLWCNIAGLGIALVFLALLISSIVYFEWSTGATIAMLSGIFLLAVATPVAGLLYYRSTLKSFVPEITNRNQRRAEEQAKKILRDVSLENLIGLNREQLTLYHAITTRQAQSAARNSQAAMSVGFLILLVGAVVALQADDQASKLVVGVLASIGSILSGFIGRTFLTAQQRAMEQLYRYWQQPLATSYLLSAERLVKELSDETSKDQMLATVIGQVLAAALFREGDHDRRIEPMKLSQKGTNKGGQPTGTRPVTSNELRQPVPSEVTSLSFS